MANHYLTLTCVTSGVMSYAVSRIVVIQSKVFSAAINELRSLRG